MLFIKSLKLTNFGRHKSLSSEIQGHVAGLAGPNGKGKSTVLQALQFALTGTIDHPDPLRAFIRRESGDNPPKHAEVEVEFVADGKEGRIVRRITRTSVTRKLWWDGTPPKKPITSDKKVSAILYDILGVDKKAINSTVFIRQGEMASMFGQETDRRGFYTRLLMLGHLEKIGKHVDVYRQSQADSVQDLGAAKDAADGQYREAEAFFNACDKALGELASPAEEMQRARAAQVRYSKYNEAFEAHARAAAGLAQKISGDMEVDDFLEATTRDLDEAHSEMETLANRKNAYLVASAEVGNIGNSLAEDRRLLEDFSELTKATAELEEAKVDIEDPTEKINSAKKILADFEHLAGLTDSVPDLQERTEEKQKTLAEVETRLKAEQEIYDKAREDYRAQHADYDMRRNILQGIEKAHGHLEGQPCPVCGSEDPSKEYLEKTMRESFESLQVLEKAGKESGERLADIKDEFEMKSADYRRTQERLEAARSEQKRLRAELVLRDRQETERELEAAQGQLEAFLVSKRERERLQGVVAAAEAKVRGKSCPTANECAQKEEAYTAAKKALQDAPWGPADGQKMEAVTAQAKRLSDLRDTLRKDVADLDAAATYLDRISKELGEALEGLKTAFPGESTITQAMVDQLVEELERRQETYEQAKGRQEAARESLRAAGARVTEVETKAAEQVVRLKLVKDLEALRDVFKPNGASMDYLDYKFGQIAQLAGDYLAESGADFMVAPSEELPLSFDFLRTDREGEVWMGQSRMSGGQKVRLAVATLRAIHAMIMPNVGLLVLDEPTTHLDDEVVRSMAEMLQKIGDEGTLQMIVCDHSPTLIDAFSDQIVIPE